MVYSVFKNFSKAGIMNNITVDLMYFYYIIFYQGFHGKQSERA